MMTVTIGSVPPRVLAVLSAGPQRSAINGEVPSVTLQVDNARGEAASALAVPPLRAPAVLRDHGTVLFAGMVQAVDLDELATITLEA